MSVGIKSLTYTTPFAPGRTLSTATPLPRTASGAFTVEMPRRKWRLLFWSFAPPIRRRLPLSGRRYAAWRVR